MNTRRLSNECFTIEMIGPPGAGKSTLIRSLGKGLETETLKLFPGVRKLSWYGVAHTRSKKAFAHFFHALGIFVKRYEFSQRYMPLFSSDKERKTFFDTILQATCIPTRRNLKMTARAVELLEDLISLDAVGRSLASKPDGKPKWIVFDELFVHTAILLSFSAGRDCKTLAKLLESSPLSDVYIVLRERNDVCMARVASRDGEKRDVSEIPYYNDVLDLTSGILRNRGATVIDVTSEMRFDQNFILHAVDQYEVS